MERRCPLCRWQVLAPLTIGLSLAAMAGGCGLVQSDVADRSRAALSGAGLTGIAVDASYRDVTLRGPGSAREQALAAVAGLDATREVTFVADDAATAPLGEGVLDLRGTYDGTAITLTGEVASEAERARLVAAATAAVGAGNVRDEMTIGAGPSSAALDGATEDLATLIEALPTGVRTASFALEGTDLTVSGVARTAAAKSRIESAVAGLATVTATASIDPPPSPAAQAADLEARLRSVARASTINFASGSASFLPGTTAVLDRVARLIGPAARQVPSLRVEVQGHTDDQGAADANQQLSLRRAQAVVDYLAGRGVARSRLAAAGFGESRPVGDNATEAGRRANRRIEFDVRS